MSATSGTRGAVSPAPDDVARLLLTATPATRLGITALSLEEVFSRLVGTHRAENPAASRTA